MKIILILMLMTGTASASSMGNQYRERQYVKAIIGEAEGEGFNGMYAVSCAIRNRGTLKGVYGLNAPRVRGHKYSAKTYHLAELAWRLSEHGKDVTMGASYWEGCKFKKPYWAYSMKETITIGNQRFYKKG